MVREDGKCLTGWRINTWYCSCTCYRKTYHSILKTLAVCLLLQMYYAPVQNFTVTSLPLSTTPGNVIECDASKPIKYFTSLNKAQWPLYSNRPTDSTHRISSGVARFGAEHLSVALPTLQVYAIIVHTSSKLSLSSVNVPIDRVSTPVIVYWEDETPLLYCAVRVAGEDDFELLDLWYDKRSDMGNLKKYNESTFAMFDSGLNFHTRLLSLYATVGQ
ncbi:hypothetical protein J6590_031771 [Homalodisca vitripennis]|nr:hypothetical protein J6590_031771 [Homalodisca vitripennis]